jgi:RNA polymerase sigma factor FliA
MTETALWRAYHDEADDDARSALLERHLPLVRYVARDLWKQINGKLELQDLVSAGTMGLIDAVEGFDPGRGLAFSTFATPRIRGAMLDHIRRWDHVPRSVRRKQRALQEGRETLGARMGREPTRAELAGHLDMDLEVLCRWESDISDAIQVALDAPLRGEGKTTTPEEILAGETGEESDQRISHGQEVALLKEAIAELPERERLVLTLYYYEDLKMHQIAAMLGVTESRISQIRSKVLKSLRSRIGHAREQYA